MKAFTYAMIAAFACSLLMTAYGSVGVVMGYRKPV